MNVHFKITGPLYEAIHQDLARPHPFAAERVGFIACRCGESRDGIIVVAHTYLPLADDQYVEDWSVGAMMSSAAIRGALQHSLTEKACMFHVHEHAGVGIPGPSRTDTTEWANFVPNFWNVQPNLPHGALIFSSDRAMGLCWITERPQPVPINRFTVAAAPLRKWKVSQ